MPPKAKFTREEIVLAALAIVEEGGREALTARSLGKKLGSSARPIFTVFRGMDEVMKEVYACANAVYGGYVQAGLRENPAFRGVGRSYIRFAAERPGLFRLLFMNDRGERFDETNVLRGIEEHYEEIIDSIVDGYGVGRQTAIQLYLHLWVYTHGIAVMTATRLCTFTGEQITKLMSEVFLSLLNGLKGGNG